MGSRSGTGGSSPGSARGGRSRGGGGGIDVPASLPALQGTPGQINYASDIRSRVMNEAQRINAALNGDLAGQIDGYFKEIGRTNISKSDITSAVASAKEAISSRLSSVTKETSAKNIIESVGANRGETYLRFSVLRSGIKNEAIKEQIMKRL